MNRTIDAEIRCEVEGPQNLPTDIGGAEAVCAAIRKAALPAIQRIGVSPAAVSVTVTVKSPYLLTAAASAGVRSIPEQKVGIADRQLNMRAIEMLAGAIAQQLETLGASPPTGASQ